MRENIPGSTPCRADPPTPSATPKAPMAGSAKKASSPPLSFLSGCGLLAVPKSRCSGRERSVPTRGRPPAVPWRAKAARNIR